MDKVAEIAPEAHAFTIEVALGPLMLKLAFHSVLAEALQVELAVVLCIFRHHLKLKASGSY